jgi:hypothetical protein
VQKRDVKGSAVWTVEAVGLVVAMAMIRVAL